MAEDGKIIGGGPQSSAQGDFRSVASTFALPPDPLPVDLLEPANVLGRDSAVLDPEPPEERNVDLHPVVLERTVEMFGAGPGRVVFELDVVGELRVLGEGAAVPEHLVGPPGLRLCPGVADRFVVEGPGGPQDLQGGIEIRGWVLLARKGATKSSIPALSKAEKMSPHPTLISAPLL